MQTTLRCMSATLGCCAVARQEVGTVSPPPSARSSIRRRHCDPRTRDTQRGDGDVTSWMVASISVVVLDPRIAPRDQATWAFTDGDDAMAMAGFLNTRIGGGKEIAWVEVVPFARKLNKKALRYLDCWADLAEEQRGGDERVQ